MLKRTLTALVAIPIAYFLISAGGYMFSLGVLLLGMVGWHEFRKMVATKGYRVYYLSSGLAVAGIIFATGLSLKPLVIEFLTLAILGIMLEALYYHDRGNWAPEVAMSSCAVLYIGLLFSHIILLRHVAGGHFVTSWLGRMELGEAFLWLALCGTWASDTFAYIFGCAFGKHSLMPTVSPKKSIEGAIAGFVGCVIVVTVLGTMWLKLNMLGVLGLAFVIAIFAPLGDLVESLMKRTFDIKDSGNFFPGHGGVLDRFDSLLFVAPLAYYYILSFLLK